MVTEEDARKNVLKVMMGKQNVLPGMTAVTKMDVNLYDGLSAVHVKGIKNQVNTETLR